MDVEIGIRNDWKYFNKYVQGQELISTAFECRNLVLGISEVV